MTCSYYDGPLPDSQLTQEEREKKLQEAIIENEKLTEWPEN